MRNFIQPGKTVTVAAPAAVLSGDVVAIGALVGVAAYSAESGAEVEIATEGVFVLPKVPANSVLVGDRLYWDSTLGQATNIAGDGAKPLIGVAVTAGGSGAVSVECSLFLTGVAGPA